MAFLRRGRSKSKLSKKKSATNVASPPPPPRAAAAAASPSESESAKSKALSDDTAVTSGSLERSSPVEFADEETRQLYSDATVLLKEYPTTTFEECIRFRTIRTMKSARKNLDAYMIWRKAYRLDDLVSNAPTFENNEEIWEYAVAHSLTFFPGVKLKKKLPRIVRIVGTENLETAEKRRTKRDSEPEPRKRTLFVMSAMIDMKIASLDLYALAFAMYFFLVMDRESLEYVNVFADDRNGPGWGNHSATSLYPLSKKLLKHLDHFPQRMHKFYVCPVPLAAQLLWGLCKKFMKPKVVEKVNIHWGNNFDVCPPSFKLDEETLELLDTERKAELSC